MWTHAGGGTVAQCGVAAPSETLIGRKLAGTLTFEEHDAFAECVAVIVPGVDRRCEQ